jgi:nucleotide-binding universal stress UspA family protein
MTPATAHCTVSSPTSARQTPGTRREPVLVALKPYDGSDAALNLAQWLAADQERPLHAITVVEPHEMVAIAAGIPALPDRCQSEERTSIAALLKERLSRLPGAHGTAGRVDVVDGPAAPTVADVARERAAHAIVVGTGQHGALGRLV